MYAAATLILTILLCPVGVSRETCSPSHDMALLIQEDDAVEAGSTPITSESACAIRGLQTVASWKNAGNIELFNVDTYETTSYPISPEGVFMITDTKDGKMYKYSLNVFKILCSPPGIPAPNIG